MALSIMIQGTMSNAGKSMLTAGLCRVFSRDGYRVAPFKSQNMALNSYITEEGLEMGRAQVVQAEAAGIKPSVLMNPILLKPTGDSVSQVIVNGRVLGNYSAKDYFSMKKRLVPDIMRAYEELSSRSDIIVIEGAGSPAEINLRENDIVNMGMARMANAPVLLVGDIDRGGVFAQLYGTAALLEEDERRYLKGLVINKFRGDVSILRPGLDQIEKLTGVPVLGVLPFMHLDIDDEDSLSEKLSVSGSAPGLVDVAVIRLPRISNFTDFSVYSRIRGVSLRYVDSALRFGHPDLVILPGTKNTIGDLIWLRECGLEALIRKEASSGRPVIGICGGYQMLGETLSDPLGAEGGGTGEKTVRGIGLLPVDTVFSGEKTRSLVRGRIVHPSTGFGGLAGKDIEGYELHMGISTIREGSGALPLARIRAVSGDSGTVKEDGCTLGNVCGSYVHGIFDSGRIASFIAAALAEKKGVSLVGPDLPDAHAYKESQYDLLADAVRENLDMDAVYRVLKGGV